MLETLLSHYLFQKGAALGLQRQRVIALELFIQWRNFVVQVLWWKIVEPVGSIGIAEGNNQRPVEVRLAKNFKFVGVLVPLEVGSVSFLIQDVQAYRLTHDYEGVSGGLPSSA